MRPCVEASPQGDRFAAAIQTMRPAGTALSRNNMNDLKRSRAAVKPVNRPSDAGRTGFLFSATM
jgi:hypothetical protein